MLRKRKGTSDAEANYLREQIARYIRNNEEKRIGGVTVGEWVTVETRAQCRAFAARMEEEGWGGAVELAAFSSTWDARIQTCMADKNRSREAQYTPIAGFGEMESPLHIKLLFAGGNHYDNLFLLNRDKWKQNGHGRSAKSAL